MTFLKEKININQLNVSSRSCCGYSTPFFPIYGNYFSLQYEGRRCNIMNMSSEDFEEIKRLQLIKSFKLIEIIREDGTSTNGFLLHSKKLDPKWFLRTLWTYGTNLKDNDIVSEKDDLIKTLIDKKLAINYVKEDTVTHTDVENIIINKTNSFYDNHNFIYLEEDDEVLLKLKKELKDTTNKSYDNRLEVFDSNLSFLDKLSLEYKVTYTDFGNLYNYCENNSNYINGILGYSIFDKDTQTVNHFIVKNENLMNTLKEWSDYEKFKINCNHLTESGKYKFHTLMEKEKKEKFENFLIGQDIDNEYSNIHIQYFLDDFYKTDYKNYSRTEGLTMKPNLENFISILKKESILKYDNQVLSLNDTKTKRTAIYFHEATIESEISEIEIIVRISSNNRTFNYLKFIKNNTEWCFKSVKRNKITTIEYN